MELVPDLSIPGSEADPPHHKAFFSSAEGKLDLDLRYVLESSLAGVPDPKVELKTLDLTDKGHKGLSVYAHLELVEGQAVTFILRTPSKHTYPDAATRPSMARANELGVPYDSSSSSVAPLGDHNANYIVGM